MNVFYLGGMKSGESVSIPYSCKSKSHCEKNPLEWRIKIQMEGRTGFQTVARKTMEPDYEFYDLTILTHQSISKLFYVCKGLSKDEVKRLSLKYWDDAESIGFQF